MKGCKLTSEMIDITQWLSEEEKRKGFALSEPLNGQSSADYMVCSLRAMCIFAVRLDHELRANNAFEKERLNFEAFSDYGKSESAEYDFLCKTFFRVWVQTSPNIFAVVYRRGEINALAEYKRSKQTKAVKGRLRIGAKTRAKVAGAAKPFMHLSKDDAAFEMKDIVNLGAGTIRRYLTEIFPGNKWKK